MSPGPSKKPNTILVVDDDPGIREVLPAMLQMHGFQVLAADDGPEALELYRNHRGEIATVVTDMRMPRMHGTQLMTELRAADPMVRIIGMTGYYGKQEAGLPNDITVLRKPVTASQLLQALALLGVEPTEAGAATD